MRSRFRKEEPGERHVRERIRRFFLAQYELLAREPVLTRIALRATTYPKARVARRVLALQDRTIGLLSEILMQGRMRGELARDVDVLAAARTLFHLASGVRGSWANGLLDEEACRDAIESAVDLVFRGVGAS